MKLKPELILSLIIIVVISLCFVILNLNSNKLINQNQDEMNDSLMSSDANFNDLEYNLSDSWSVEANSACVKNADGCIKFVNSSSEIQVDFLNTPMNNSNFNSGLFENKSEYNVIEMGNYVVAVPNTKMVSEEGLISDYYYLKFLSADQSTYSPFIIVNGKEYYFKIHIMDYDSIKEVEEMITLFNL